MIGSVGSSRIPDQTGQSLPAPPATRAPDVAKVPSIVGRRAPVGPDQSVPPGSPRPAGDRIAGTFSEQVVLAIRPMAKAHRSFRPAYLRASLSRLRSAIENLETVEQDPLLKTAHSILAEEQLRAELLSQRLQMILEG